MKNNKAVALVLAMFILVFISMIIAALLMLVTSDLQIISNHMGRLKALYLAEAGVEDAISELRNSKTWSRAADLPSIIFPSGSTNSYDVTYPKTGTSRMIESLGQADNFTAKIEAQVSIAGAATPYTIKIVSYQETG